MSNIVWLRRDLRLKDNYALASAARESDGIVIVFVYDSVILNQIKNRSDRRMTFIEESLLEIDQELKGYGSRLIVRYGDPIIEIPKLSQELKAKCVYVNRDYEPYAKERDAKVKKNLFKIGIDFKDYKDQVIFEKDEILSKSLTPFKIYSHYKRVWFATINQDDYKEVKTDFGKLIPAEKTSKQIIDISLEKIKFNRVDNIIKGGSNAASVRLRKFAGNIDRYPKGRDLFSKDLTSNLATDLRFGTISVRELVRFALKQNSKGSLIWLSQLIWRDFFNMILDKFPYVQTRSFRQKYDRIKWQGKSEHFERWCDGMTGYPVVDAAMRRFNKTGMMHNRLRMIVGSFLVKDLLVDWRKGERYFADNLLDYDLALNNGNWQWVAGTGCDAQPYFRIFNPVLQSKKFDLEGEFIKNNVDELRDCPQKYIHFPFLRKADLGIKKYPDPIVDHSVQKLKAIRLLQTSS